MATTPDLLGIPTSDLIAVFLEQGYSVDHATEMAADMLIVQRSRMVDDLVRGWQNRNAAPLLDRLAMRRAQTIEDNPDPGDPTHQPV
jgi:hypothetical protein